MNYGKIFMALSVIAAFLFVSCTSRETPTYSGSQIESPPKSSNNLTSETWRARWEKTLAAARKEGRVVVYGGSTAAGLKLHATRPIKEKFGLDLEVLSGRGSEIRAKIGTERNNGLFIPDIYTSGVSSMYDFLKPTGAVDPIEPVLILPEVADTRGWFDNRLPWGDEEHKVFIWAGYPNPQIAINTNMVKPNEINSYQDLLNPKWKGKIVINDPTLSEGSGFTGFTALLYNKIVDLDFFRKIVKEQQPTMLRDQHLQINWLFMGRFPIALWPSTGRMAEYIEAGAPIAWLTTKEGVHLAGGGAGLGLMNKAPHPNAAIVFVNWFLSKEGQYLIQNSVDKQSMRIDIQTDKVDPAKTRQAGVKYFIDPNNIEKFVVKEYESYLNWSKEVFSPLMK